MILRRLCLCALVFKVADVRLGGVAVHVWSQTKLSRGRGRLAEQEQSTTGALCVFYAVYDRRVKEALRGRQDAAFAEAAARHQPLPA